jgi:hypothetical protein
MVATQATFQIEGQSGGGRSSFTPTGSKA